MLLGAANAKSLVPAAPGRDQRIESHELAIDVHERAAAAARVDGRVRLHIDHRRVGLHLARDRTDDAERDRVVQAERTAAREHELSRFQFFGIAERQRRQVLQIDLDDREIGLHIDADHLSRHGSAPRREDRLPGDRHGNLDAQPLGAGDDVRVRDDVAIGSDNDARSRCALGRDEIGVARHDALPGRERRREDLDDGRADDACRRFERSAEVGGRGDGAWLRLIARRGRDWRHTERNGGYEDPGAGSC